MNFLIFLGDLEKAIQYVVNKNINLQRSKVPECPELEKEKFIYCTSLRGSKHIYISAQIKHKPLHIPKKEQREYFMKRVQKKLENLHLLSKEANLDLLIAMDAHISDQYLCVAPKGLNRKN